MDTRLQTFLMLCKLMNYRLTAEAMHLTQPAVTKQIQSLEQFYNTKLFVYDGRKLQKTKDCITLEAYCKSLRYNYEEMKKTLCGSRERLIRIGATKTIGDYVIGENILKYLSRPEHNLSLVVDNTERLMQLLDDSELDFAIVEGLFPKSKYQHRLLQEEPFIGICTKEHPFANRIVSVEDIVNETLIVREQGSGTRDILEHELMSLGYDLTAFPKVICISSFQLIRQLILQNIGVSFMYNAVIKDDSSFATFRLENFKHIHEFNIVYLKNTNAEQYVDLFFS